MIILKKFFLVFFVFLFLPFGVFADSGHSTVVMDFDSGRLLYKNNINEKRLIASITKIMTCIVTLENADINKKIIVGDEVLKMYGTNIYIEENEELTIKDLLYGLMLRSGNDASVVLAKNVFDSEEIFIKKMNEKALEIGMYNTEFYNPHGLDDDTKNYSTAYDMALLARYAYKNEMYKKIISTKKYVTKSNKKSYVWYNRMSLINNYKYCVGGKNGYTPKAGKTLVSYASKNDVNLIIVSLDDNDIYANHEGLYEKYFDMYKKYAIIDKNNFEIDSSLINKDVYIKKSFYYLLSDDEFSSISTVIKLNNNINNNVVGKVIINFDGEEIGNLDIFTFDKKKKNSLSILHKFKNLFIS